MNKYQTLGNDPKDAKGHPMKRDDHAQRGDDKMSAKPAPHEGSHSGQYGRADKSMSTPSHR